MDMMTVRSRLFKPSKCLRGSDLELRSELDGATMDHCSALQKQDHRFSVKLTVASVASTP
ncbi:hypothetical protein KP509_32G025200 [Ceratopteris richardii]|uniref:Uncharacterized protein n=1 Tax=Ceratopteris richardii TaxID=49495 RepID=A0A8T2QTD6_CERRI|nr:hypothetical protein KP509_32G025200 [Ceratopteris richardii]